MCEICQHAPCLPLCPNRGAILVGQCTYKGCRCDIYDDEFIYVDQEGNMFCDVGCVLGFYNVDDMSVEEYLERKRI